MHEADIERNGAVARATAPARGGVREAALLVVVAVKFGVILETVGQILLSFFGKELLFGVASTLSSGVGERDVGLNEVTIDFEKTAH